MSERKRFQTDRQKVAGLGSAKEGVGHWWQQRVTAVALLPLLPLFVITFGRSLGQPLEAVQAIYGHPFHAIVAILTIIVAVRHLQLGLQVVIEDYVHDHALKTSALLANTLLTWALMLAGVFGVAKLAFSA